MNDRLLRELERSLIVAASDIEDLGTAFTKQGARSLVEHRDRRANATAHLEACVARVARCVEAIRQRRRGRL